MPHTVLLATDHKRSVIAELAGGPANAIAYSAYGHPSASQSITTQVAFNGELRERVIGWYFLGSGYRAYNPKLMCFHGPDTSSPFDKGGLNAYRYCEGDPINYSDPTGHGRFARILKFLGLGKSQKAGKYLRLSEASNSTQSLVAQTQPSWKTLGADVQKGYRSKTQKWPDIRTTTFVEIESPGGTKSLRTFTDYGPRPSNRPSIPPKSKDVNSTLQTADLEDTSSKRHVNLPQPVQRTLPDGTNRVYKIGTNHLGQQYLFYIDRKSIEQLQSSIRKPS